MNRKEFVEEIAKKKGISKAQAYHAVNAVMDTLRLVMMQGESVEIGGFGTFLVMTDLKGERIPTFSGGRTLRRVMNTLNTTEDEL